MSFFLSVPLKQTSEVDLIKPLSRYIESVPGLAGEVRVRTIEGVVELNKLRRAIANPSSSKQQSSLDLLTRYYDQLCAIEKRLPMTPIQNPISFKWRDAFAKNSIFSGNFSLAINDAGFERAAVLFNCGAMMSGIASSQNIYTDEELRNKARLYQQAAGVFASLREKTSLLISQEPTSDLFPETLSALSTLMLAQAQETIYIKAVKDGLNVSLLAKIASQCSDLYQLTQALMAHESVNGIWEKDWLMNVSGKGLAYSAIAQHRQATTLDSVNDIAEKLSRLEEAVRVMDQCASYLPASSNLLKEAAVMRSALERSSKDNDCIYHVRATDVKKLPPIGKALLAKPTPLSSPMSPRFKDIFDFLPDPATVRMPLLERSHSTISFPEGLDADNKLAPMESIVQRAARIKLRGGVDAVKWKLNELSCLHKHNVDILNEALRLLDEEKREDDAMRAQFRSKWKRLSSASLTQPLLQELSTYRNKLISAKSVDASIARKFVDHARGIELLSKPEIEVRSAVARTDQDKNTLRLLSLAYEAFFDLETNMTEGTKFYTELSPILIRVQQQVADYCYARRTEKGDLLNQIHATPPRRVSGNRR